MTGDKIVQPWWLRQQFFPSSDLALPFRIENVDFSLGTYVMVTGRPTQISQSSVTIKASRIAELSATEEFAWESEVMDIQLRIMEKY